MPHWLEAVIIFISALVLFRLNGKETLTMMRPGQFVVMLGIAVMLIEPLKSKNIWVGFYSGALLVMLSALTTYVHIYFPKTGRWLIGQPIILIKNGEILKQNLKRARISLDDLKMRIRIEKISDISMIKVATLETSGKLGIELFPEHLYATKKDIEELMEAINLIGSKLNVTNVNYIPPQSLKNDLFVQTENMQEQDPLQ